MKQLILYIDRKVNKQEFLELIKDWFERIPKRKNKVYKYSYVSKLSKERIKLNIEQKNKLRREYYQKNKEKLKNKEKEYYYKNKLKKKIYYETNKEIINETNKIRNKQRYRVDEIYRDKIKKYQLKKDKNK